MMKTMSTKEKVIRIIQYAVLVLFLVACIYPILWLICNSFKTQDDLFANTWGLPTQWTLENYRHAIIDGNIGRYFLNSCVVSLMSVILTVVLALMASFGLTRLRWKLAGTMLNVFLLGMMIPAYGSIIPLYSMFSKMRILNHYIAVVIPHVTFALPMAIYILTGFLSGIPKELEEAAMIDGCSVFKCFWKIITPVVSSGVVTVAVITFINIWNDLLFSQIFLSDKDKMPLPIGLTEFQGIYATDYVGMIAAIVVTVLPVIIVYTILHNRIVDGMIAGAVKG